MRILDLITEAGPTTYVPASPGSPIVVPTPLTPSPAPSPAPSSPKGPKKRFTPKSIWDQVKARASKNKRRVSRAEYVFENKYGWKLRLLFKLIGLTALIISHLSALEELDEQYKSGELLPGGTEDEKRQAFEEAREFAWGLFQTAAIAPAAARMLSRALLVTKIARLIKNIIAVGSAGVSFGASLVAAAASEAFFIWLQQWIMSDSGKAWFAEYLGSVIRYFGKPADAIVNQLHAAWNSSQGKPGDYYDQKQREREQAGNKDQAPDGQGAQAAAEPEASRSTETWPRDIRYENQNRIYVGGTKVTDHTGKLIPGIQNVLAVQGARATADRRKLKDPLADIPQQPGQPPIKPI